MSRHLLTAAVVAADVALQVALDPAGWPVLLLLYALAAVAVAVAGSRGPAGPGIALTAALLLAWLAGGGYPLLLWAAYRAGRSAASRLGIALPAAAAAGSLGAQLALQRAGTGPASHLISVFLVFVALPMLAGRYLAQHERLVTALHQHNRQLRWRQESLAQQERLRERLRIAGDIHDSLGHRLSLLSIQAAALEVTAPPPQRQAAARIAAAARAACDDLHEVVGLLRRDRERPVPGQGPGAIAGMVADFRAAGVPASLTEGGQPQPLPPAAAQAAYRVAEEGLTNAAKHAPGQAVTVSLQWEAGSLILTVANGITAPPGPAAARAGHGLPGLRERVRSAGGLLEHTLSAGTSRLCAMLPTVPEPEPEPAAASPGGPRPAWRPRPGVLGLATATMLLVVLPAVMLAGVR